MAIEAYDAQILSFLEYRGGYATGTVASTVHPQFGHNKRTHSAFVRTRLLHLEQQGLVKRLDDRKPALWMLATHEGA